MQLQYFFLCSKMMTLQIVLIDELQHQLAECVLLFLHFCADVEKIITFCDSGHQTSALRLHITY